jgi:iron complex outermembrane recepter protein
MRAIVMATVICFSMVGVSRARETMAAIRRPPDIEPQALETALRKFAESRNLQVLYLSQTVGRTRTAGASGKLTTNQALTKLLSGTGLTYRYVSYNAVTILPTPGPDEARTAAAASLPLFAGTGGEKREGLKEASRGFIHLTLADTAVEKSDVEPQSESGQKVEESASDPSEVVVTGSHIVREGYESPTPLTVLGAEEIEKSADPNLLGTLNALPAISGSQTGTLTQGRQGESLSGVQSMNLRGLGANRVLVLLDGVRMSPASYTNYVDVNTVPEQLISRVDVVTGGASAVYGSDAVAGVVNFVLDRKFTGLKGEVSGGLTNYSDDQNYKVALTGGFGFADKRGHVLLSAERMLNDGTGGTDGGRQWNEQGWGMLLNPAYTPTNGLPQNLFLPQTSSITVAPGGIIVSGPLRGTAFGPGGVPYQFQYGPIVGTTAMAGGGDWRLASNPGFGDLDPAESNQNLFARLSYDLTDHVSIFGQGTYSENRVHGPFAESMSGTATAYVVQQDNAYLPAAIRDQMLANNITSFGIGSWNQDMPKGPYSTYRATTRFTGGFEGNFNVFDTTWHWNATYAYGKSHFSLHNNTFITSRLKLSLDAVVNPATGQIVCRSTLTAPTNGCKPWDFMGTGVNAANLTAGAFEWMTDGGQWENGLIEQTTEAASLNAEPFSLWAGPVSVAASFEHRTDKIDSAVDAFSAASQRQGANYAPLAGKQSVTEGALETVIPLAKDLTLARNWDLSLAARATGYELSGYVTTYKVGTTYTPIDDIKFRLTRSRDIRAPSIQELFASPAGFSASLLDRFLNTQVPGSPFYLVEGNPNLKPEKADTTDIGIVLQPRFLPGFRASVDYWDVDINGAIQPLQAQQVIDACYYQIVPSICQNIQRGADGNITSVLAFPVNLAKFDTRGIDLEASYRMALSNIVSSWPGDFALHGFATIYLRAYQNSQFVPPIDIVGSNYFGSAGATANAIPNWKLSMTGTYHLSRWAFSLTGRGFGDGTLTTAIPYTACTSGCPPSTAANPTINSNFMPGRLYLDTNLNYTFDFGSDSTAELFFSVKNVLNSDPPPVPSAGNAILYDLLGRVYRAGIRFKL